MDMAYTKLHQSLVTSTIWREPHPTRIVWITMMALADQHGEVMASVPGLADASRVSIQECEEALRSFLGPDPYSRTKDFDGRRIEEIDGGWSLLNHPKYRRMASKDESKEKASARTARYRARLREQKASQTVDSHALSTVGRDIAEAEAEAEAEEKKKSKSAKNQEEQKPPTDCQKFAIWFYGLLDDSKKPTGNWKDSFAKAYDELTRIDGHSKDEIKAVCEFGTSDDFWKSNFALPSYLRKKSKTTGLKHFEQIRDAMNKAQKPIGKPPVNLSTVKL
jgi:hypothetical protein